MMSEILKRHITSGWVDPFTKSHVTLPLKTVRIEAGLIGQARTLMSAFSWGDTCALVCDEETYRVAGRTIEQDLKEYCKITHVFPAGLPATEEAVNTLLTKIEGIKGLVAVGGGTINDICKYASFSAGKPYAVFGTAPSMNGYASATASLMVDGHKKSLKAHLPEAIFLDLEVLASSPMRLIRSGVADVLCWDVAQLDWYASHLICGSFYIETPFEWIAPYDALLMQQAAALKARDMSAMKTLAEMLILSGLGMVYCHGSAPASQGEHMIAHMMDMIHDGQAPGYHGEQVAVTSVTMAALQGWLLEQAPSTYALPAVPEAALKRYLPEEAVQHCLQETEAKYSAIDNVCLDIKQVSVIWEKLQEMYQGAKKRRIARLAMWSLLEIPKTPKSLGWDNTLYKYAVLHAPYMRERFTFLDLAVLSGKLKLFTEEIMSL